MKSEFVLFVPRLIWPVKIMCASGCYFILAIFFLHFAMRHRLNSHSAGPNKTVAAFRSIFFLTFFSLVFIQFCFYFSFHHNRFSCYIQSINNCNKKIRIENVISVFPWLSVILRACPV